MLIRLRKDAAKALRITERALGYWKNEPGFPDCSCGYDIAAIREWRAANHAPMSGKNLGATILAEVKSLRKLVESLIAKGQ